MLQILDKRSIMTRIEREKWTVQQMVRIYCKAHHSGPHPCTECQELMAYAHARLDRCKFGERKGTCKKCPIHCYKPDRREQMRQVMRYAGPRMLLHHPIAALRHMLGA